MNESERNRQKDSPSNELKKPETSDELHQGLQTLKKMASLSEKDPCCPVCRDAFNDPVLLSCRHTFCRGCVDRWWNEKRIKQCPVCKKSSMSRLPVNFNLNTQCKEFLKDEYQSDSLGSGSVCSLHSKKLGLFCLDDQQPICLVCRDSKTHKEHKIRPIDEAAQGLREELEKSLRPLREKLKLFEEVKGNFDRTADYIKVQARYTQRQIQEEFEKIHQFLKEEEEVRMAALREEEEQKSQLMKKKIEALSGEIAALSDTIRTTEEELTDKDISFLLNYKTAVERVQQRPLLDDPQLHSGALIDMAKHLGNLAFNTWDRMKDIVSYTPVVLDPNSAHPALTLSEDLTSVSFTKRQKLPENPERFDYFSSVIGSKGFNSGSHSWNVEVGDNNCWFVGLITESVQRKGNKAVGYWGIFRSRNEYMVFSTSGLSSALPVKKFKRIRVHLDWNRRNLSFSDPDSNANIHTFRHAFTETMFPYIRNGSPEPLTILPAKLSVTKELEKPEMKKVMTLKVAQNID